MGIYLNPGNDLFQESLNSKIYVDKTELIHFTNRIMNTEGKLVCVSRPRRFGKSMALKMLSAYYSKGCDSGEMFENLKVSRKTGTDVLAEGHVQAYEKTGITMMSSIWICREFLMKCWRIRHSRRHLLRLSKRKK